MTVEEMIDIVRNEYIEQIYALKSEVESKSKELEVYKKALRIACSQIDTIPMCTTEEYKNCRKSLGSCGECWANVYLQKAGAEE